MSIGLILGIVVVLGIIIALFLIWKSSDANSSRNSKNIIKQIDELKKYVEREDDSIKKKILNNQIGSLSLEEAKQRIEPLIKKYSEKVLKSPKPEWKDKLKQYECELENANKEADLLRYDVMAELSDDEKKKYAAFCETYRVLRNSRKIWMVDYKTTNKQVKASAGTIVNRIPFAFSSGLFNQLEIPYDVPKIPISDQKNYYFYPRFIIVTKRSGDFDVLPLSDVSIQYTSTRFHEEERAPSDAERVGTTYRYVNKDGGRDMRFSNNPMVLVLLYGDIKIKPFGDEFLISNNAAAQNWKNSFMELKRQSESFDSDGCSGKDLERKSFKHFGRELGEQVVNSILEKHGVQTVAPKITRLYFEDILYESKRIQDFSNTLANDEAFLKIVNEKIKGDITVNGKVLTDTKDRLPYYVLGDILNCYNGLNHSLELDKPEGLGLFIFSMLFLQPDVKIEYERLNLLYACYKTPMETLLKKPNEATKLNDGSYMIEYCLKGYNKSLHNQYLILLYRFTSLVAKADKKVTEIEAKWLNEILALKEPERVEDVISPIIPKNSITEGSSQVFHEGSTKELETLIGLASVKSEISSLANYIKIQKMRQEKGMKITPISYHCVFTGNPGTGKTTVARIVSEIYKELGILKKGHLVETDRSGLVAEYVGQTAMKTNSIIDSALDGILFIDEAYSLVDGGNSDYGKEAISTLLKRMEDDRDRLVVILAGYTDDMKRFIASNPGLQSRFNRYIEFPDYSAEELFQIFELNTKKYEYKLTDAAQSTLKDALIKVVSEKNKNFGNGRYVRNLFEKVVEHQANRLSSEADVTSETLALIEKEDVEKSL